MLERNDLIKYQQLKALLIASQSEKQRLTELSETGQISDQVHSQLNRAVMARLNDLQKRIAALELNDSTIDETHLKETALELIEHRKDSLQKSVKEGCSLPRSFHALELELDWEMDFVKEYGMESSTRRKSMAGSRLAS